MLIRTLWRSKSMNVDGHHLQILISLQGIDGSDDTIQLLRIATIIGTQLYLVHWEIDISPLIQMANFRCFCNDSLQLQNRFQNILFRLQNSLDNQRRNDFTLFFSLAWNQINQGKSHLGGSHIIFMGRFEFFTTSTTFEFIIFGMDIAQSERSLQIPVLRKIPLFSGSDAASGIPTFIAMVAQSFQQSERKLHASHIILSS